MEEPADVSLESQSGEHRRTARREYPFRQRYAPYREQRWPSEEEFQSAELCDISPHGLALYLSTRPATHLLVVELGIGTNVSQTLMQVVQISSCSLAGERVYRVGCEFVNTAARP
jgi:hypothetical protein